MATFNILIEKDEDGFYVSEVVELPGCHTQAKTLDELMKRTKEAILLYLKCESPVLSESSDFIGLQKIEV
ncbi:MAG: type II toxin-antitoxin system HicB family antitoxin [Nanoarchaeota archaeon]